MSAPWDNLTETQRRQIREAHVSNGPGAEPQQDRPGDRRPGKDPIQWES